VPLQERMAKPISDEELQLRKRARRRLIGAIVLVTVVVVALPMVLDSEPKPASQDIDIRIPSPDSGAFKSKVVPLAPAPEARPAAQPPGTAKPETVTSGDSAASAPATEKPEAKSQTDGGAPATKPAGAETRKTGSSPSAAGTAAAPSGRFVVQIVALSDAGKAHEMQQRIAAAGIQSYTEVVKTAKGDVTRVRAGPFETRESAEKVQRALKELGFDGKVVKR
jgi:DedD protein